MSRRRILRGERLATQAAERYRPHLTPLDADPVVVRCARCGWSATVPAEKATAAFTGHVCNSH